MKLVDVGEGRMDPAELLQQPVSATTVARARGRHIAWRALTLVC